VLAVLSSFCEEPPVLNTLIIIIIRVSVRVLEVRPSSGFQVTSVSNRWLTAGYPTQWFQTICALLEVVVVVVVMMGFVITSLFLI
jgi:hypothetical protein